MNISDRGGAGSQVSLVEDYNARRESSDIVDRRLDDVRSLSKEDITELGERYGEMRIAGEIAARAIAQMQNVKLVIDRSPSGQRQLYREGEAPELTDDDRRYLRSRELGMHYHRFHDAKDNVHALLADVVGAELAQQLWPLIDGEPLQRIVKAPKSQRRRALARELEQLTEDKDSGRPDEDQDWPA